MHTVMQMHAQSDVEAEAYRGNDAQVAYYVMLRVDQGRRFRNSRATV
jgi:hypothetical protein